MQRLTDTLMRRIVRQIARLFLLTPRPLRPCLGVSLVIVQACLTGFLTVLALNLFFDYHYVMDVPLLAYLSVCGLSSALAFGVVREYVPMSTTIRPWVLSSVASTSFFLCLILLAHLQHGRSPVRSGRDLGIFVVMTIVFAFAGGFFLRTRDNEESGPA